MANGMGRVVYLNGAVPGDVEAVNRSTAYAAALYLYVAIRYRAENLAEPPLLVAQTTDDGIELLPDHPVSQLLAEPSPDYDTGELVELTQTYLDIGGRALWVKDDNLLGETGRLTPFGEHEFKVEATRERIYGKFQLQAKRNVTLLDDKVVFFRYLNPYNRHQGLSPTDVALSWMNMGVQMKATIRSLLKNAMFPSVVISTDSDWHPTDEEFQRFKDLLDQYHSGPANAGKPFVNLGGGRADRMTFSMEQLLPEPLLNRVEACVASAFGIPPVVLSFMVGLANSPWSQMAEARRYAYEDTLEPLWRKHAKVITRQLLRPIDPDPSLKIVFDTSEVRALKDDESQKITDATNARFWTINQRLVHTGQDPLPDDDPRGDFIEAVDGMPSLVAPTGTFFQPPNPKYERPRIEAKLAPHDATWKWSRFDLMAKAQEPAWEREMEKRLDADRDAVLKVARSDDFAALWDDALESVPKAWLDSLDVKALTEWGVTPWEAKAPPPPTGDPKKVAALIAKLAEALDADQWTDSTRPLIEGTARTAAKEAAAELGISFDLLDRAVLNYAATEAAWLVTNVSKTTRDRIAAELKAGLAEGESIGKLRDRIRDTTAFSKERAELIARTETTRVSNGAQRGSLSEYATDNAVTIEKSWLSARDARVRPEHRAQDDGKWIGVDEAFDVTGLTEPSEPNCRCTLLYRMPDEAA